jgi:hypothetical protein
VATSCRYGSTSKQAEIQDRSIKEASALAASRQFPGIYWTLNDSGNDPYLFAFDEQGRSRGTFKVDGADNLDWEALQIGPGRDGGFALYVGDTGDNDGVRRDSTIYRVPEPQPLPPQSGRPRAQNTARAEAFKITFPGESRDTEAMIVHPATGQIYLLSKESGNSRVFRVPMPLSAGQTARLEQVARLDLSILRARGELVTDATITPDARRVAVRTNTSALEFDVADGEPLENIWSRTPRVARLDDGPQGEGMTYRVDGQALMTTGEDTPAELFITPLQC